MYIQEVFHSDGVNYKNHNLASFEKILENYLGHDSFVSSLSFRTAYIFI